MASDSWPSPNHNSRAVSDTEYDQLVPPYVADGVIGSPSDQALVFADSSGRNAKLRANRSGLVRGRLYSTGSSVVTMTIAANAGSTRFDLIVMRYNRSTFDVREAVVQGTSGSGIPSPVNNASFFDVPLAVVHVGSGVAVINGTDVTMVNFFVGPQTAVCTSTTRPPHKTGLQIIETDTTRWLFSTGSAWQIVFEDTGNVDIGAPGVGIATNWSAALKTVRRVNGTVHMTLQLTRTGVTLAINTDTAIATLPAGFAPVPGWQANISAIVLGSGTVVRGLIASTGKVSLTDYPKPIATGNVLSFDAASWPAGTTG